MAEYDFRDPLVLALVQGAHRPREITVDDLIPLDPQPGETVRQLRLQIVCASDYQPWPCDVVTTLRLFEKSQRRDEATVATEMAERHYG